MPEENVEIVRETFGAATEGDFARAMGYWADDIELVVPVDGFPESGIFEGRDAVEQWFGNWFGSFGRDYRFELQETRDLGEAVLVVAEHFGRGRTSGVEVRFRMAYLYRVRDRRIARIEFYAARAEALEAAGLS